MAFLDCLFLPVEELFFELELSAFLAVCFELVCVFFVVTDFDVFAVDRLAVFFFLVVALVFDFFLRDVGAELAALDFVFCLDFDLVLVFLRDADVAEDLLDDRLRAPDGLEDERDDVLRLVVVFRLVFFLATVEPCRVTRT